MKKGIKLSASFELSYTVHP